VDNNFGLPFVYFKILCLLPLSAHWYSSEMTLGLPKARLFWASIVEPDTLCPWSDWLICRGKFDLLFCAARIALRNAKTTIAISIVDVSRVYILDGMTEEKADKVALLVRFADSVTVPYGKQLLSTFALEVKANSELDIPPPRGIGDRIKACSRQSASS
jgi:hypothetical protein